MKALWLADAFRDAGLVIHPYADWENRGRTTQGEFDPQAVMWHHTVTKPTSPDADIDAFLARGRSDLPGPLCNWSTNRDGSVSIIAAGVANHAGSGYFRGLTHNREFFGDEMKNLGTSVEPWPERQLESARLAAAVALNEIGKDHTWLTFHKNYALPAGRKVDPHTLRISDEQTNVQAILEGGNMFTAHEEQQLKKLVAEIDSVNSDAGFLSELIEDIRKDIITRNELVAALKNLNTGGTTVEQVLAELVNRLS